MTPHTVRLKKSNTRDTLLTLLDSAGAAMGHERFQHPASEGTLRKHAKLFCLPLDALRAALAAYDAAGVGVGETFEIAWAQCLPAPPPGPTYLLRPINVSAGKSFDSFAAALTAAPPGGEHLITWRGLSHCAAVDLDDAADAATLRVEVLRTQPVPAFYWITRSGRGLRMIFLSGMNYTAEELAACAGVQLLLAFPNAGLEIKHDTRTPPGEWTQCEPTFDCESLKRLTGGVIHETQASEWLEAKGLVPGQRYPHTQCPVNPYLAAEANPGDALIVHEHYIRCFICGRDGVRFGSADPGYFPIAALSGDRITTPLKRCVRGMTHWHHARHVMASECPRLPEPVAKAAYRALLRMSRPEDVRVDRCFTAPPVVRMRGYWATTMGESIRADKYSAILARLPCAQREDGSADAERIEWLSQATDLTPEGYPPLTSVAGYRLTANQPQPTGRVFAVFQTPDLRSDEMASRRPRYIKPETRMDIDAAWELLEEAYPRVDRKLVELLIVMKGCTEIRAGLPPMLFIYGPTGAGKTATPMLAAGICGDHVHKVPYTRDNERQFAAIREARSRGSFLVFDEFLKGAQRARHDPEQAMEFSLELDEDAVTHKLYTGPVPVGDLPGFIWCDTVIPDAVAQHEQIGRRLHYAQLPETLRWESSLAACGIAKPDKLRLSPDPRFADAANVILSAVQDRWFVGEPVDFAVVAETLGFAKLQDSDRAGERLALVRELFRLACDELPAVPTELGKRLPVGSTWRYINLDSDTPAAIIWGQLADRTNPAACRAIDEMDLKDKLGLACPAKCERRAHERKVAIRFFGEGKANGELRK